MAVDSRLTHHGHVSYLEIPATDVAQSAAFYEAVFGWQVHRRESGQTSFDDGTGSFIGRWVPEHAPSRQPGFLPYVYVDRIDDVIGKATARGAEIVMPPYPEGDLWVATFRDPAGNLIGIWQAGPR
jgi:predicted enzyme related to lactoylglutathione lyase